MKNATKENGYKFVIGLLLILSGMFSAAFHAFGASIVVFLIVMGLVISDLNEKYRANPITQSRSQTPNAE